MSRTKKSREQTRQKRRRRSTSLPARPRRRGQENGSDRQGLFARLREAPKLTIAIGIVTLIGGILGLVAWFFPDAKPKPLAPTDASLEMLDFQGHVTLRRYLQTIDKKPVGYSPAELSRDGVVATVKAVGVSGVKRADLYWTLRDSASGADFADAHYVHQLAGRFRIRTTGDSGGRPFWVPAPPQPGRYFIRFELAAPNGTILALKPTRAFVVG
jgi:hypothetical protein